MTTQPTPGSPRITLAAIAAAAITVASPCAQACGMELAPRSRLVVRPGEPIVRSSGISVGARAITDTRLFADNLAQRYDAATLRPYAQSRLALARLVRGHLLSLPGYKKPAVNIAEEGKLELEWWNGDKCFTIFLDGERIDFLRGWGVDMRNEMEDGELSPQHLAAHWAWLNS